MADNSYLPHSNKDLWEKAKKKFEISPKNIKELNTIFFNDKSPFFEEIDKKHKSEGENFLKYYEHLRKLALNLESIFPNPEISLLKKNTTGKKELTRKEVALIFLLSFFNLIDVNQEKGRETNNFAVYQVLLSLYKIKFEFGRCFLNYLTIIGKWLSDDNPILKDKIKFIRNTIKPDIKNFKKETQLCNISINKTESLFESKASYFVDFANMFIGGGVLQGGCVQEEILFATQPEAIVSMFFMEVMSDNDAIRIDNLIQYSNYSGYAHSFKFKESAINNNDHINNMNNINNINNIKTYKIIAIDASVQYNKYEEIIEKDYIKRDIHKAFVGFNLVNFEDEKNEEKSIATGNWGCGAFNGDHELKFFQQWVAASFAGIETLDYYCYGADEMNYILKNLKEIKNKYTMAYKLFEDLINKKLFNFNVVKILLDNTNEYKNGKNDCICA